MAQLLALARDEHRIEMIDLPTQSRQVIITDTGLHPDGIVCDGTTVYWTTMGERTGTNEYGEASTVRSMAASMPSMLTERTDATLSQPVVLRPGNS